MKKAEHTEQLRTPTRGIISANAVHMRRLMQSETSHCTVRRVTIFFATALGLEWRGDYRDITPQ